MVVVVQKYVFSSSDKPALLTYDRFYPSLQSSRAIETAGAGYMGLSESPVNVLSFIQTVAATLLFQIHPRSCFASLARNKRTTVENKIAVHAVLTYEASLIGGSL
jgi:hypothetical protein